MTSSLQSPGPGATHFLAACLMNHSVKRSPIGLDLVKDPEPGLLGSGTDWPAGVPSPDDADETDLQACLSVNML